MFSNLIKNKYKKKRNYLDAFGYSKSIIYNKIFKYEEIELITDKLDIFNINTTNRLFEKG